eukprot:761445-Hanusia_phi.AAC.1
MAALSQRSPALLLSPGPSPALTGPAAARSRCSQSESPALLLSCSPALLLSCSPPSPSHLVATVAGSSMAPLPARARPGSDPRPSLGRRRCPRSPYKGWGPPAQTT